MSYDDIQEIMQKYTIKTPEQLRALGAPATHDVFVGLLKIARGSIAEIAHVLGKSPHALYHHMDKLIEVGLVLVDGERRKGARIEKIYKPVAHLFEADIQNKDPEYLAALADNARAQHRRAGQAAANAILNGEANRPPGDENTLSLQITVALTEEQRAEIVARMYEMIMAYSSDQKVDEDAMGYLITLGLSPVKSK